MNNEIKFSKHLVIVLSEMCRRIGACFDDIGFTADNWFQQYVWTEEEQEKFEKWFVDYLYANKEAREEITTVRVKNKKRLRKAAQYFLLSYGWSFTEKTMVSACCNAEVKVEGKGATHWHVCQGCKKPCNIKDVQRLDKEGTK